MGRTAVFKEGTLFISLLSASLHYTERQDTDGALRSLKNNNKNEEIDFSGNVMCLAVQVPAGATTTIDRPIQQGQ
jgi:hypothetical protein